MRGLGALLTAPVAEPAARFPLARTISALHDWRRWHALLVASGALQGLSPAFWAVPVSGGCRLPSISLRADMTEALNRAASAGDTGLLEAILTDAERIGDALRAFEATDCALAHAQRALALVFGMAVWAAMLALVLWLSVELGTRAGLAACAAWGIANAGCTVALRWRLLPEMEALSARAA